MRTNDRYGNKKPAPAGHDKISVKRNATDSPVKLMDFMAMMMPDAKRTALKTLLKYGHIKIGGNVVTQFDAPVEPGVDVTVNHTRPFIVFSSPRMQLVYEDDDIIVVNKGYGLLSMGTDSKRRDLTAYSIVKDYLKKCHPLNKVFIVHRLDRDTSGLMMFAKTQESKEAMQHNWNNMVIERRYVAVVEGVVEEDSGVIRSYLGETSAMQVFSTPDPEAGVLAITRYHVLARGNGYTLMEFSLDTGRKNQIRVHAARLGHPIVGDRKYGAKSSPIHRLALHARSLKFVHPVIRKVMDFELPVPSRFAGLVKYGVSNH